MKYYVMYQREFQDCTTKGTQDFYAKKNDFRISEVIFILMASYSAEGSCTYSTSLTSGTLNTL